MAARLIRLDCGHGSIVVVCDCGFRALTGNPGEARRAADDHRARLHPAAQRRAESKRRTRARAR
jgi:hypothetical protein